ncbi:MAG: ABC transporter substrate-binding protein [Ruminococcaceae bacterium]|nr:ABC transporter substrate-binding protein [Oscillospiraceae bacterium]
MRKLLCILLSVMVLLCSCQVSTDRNPYSDTPLPKTDADASVGDAPDGASANDAGVGETVPERRYSITELITVPGGSGQARVSGDQFVILYDVAAGDDRQLQAASFADNGLLASETSVPIPTLVRDNKDIFLPMDAYPLSDGRWFVAYEGAAVQCFIVEEDGTVQEYVQLPRLHGVYFRNIHECMKTEDGVFQILLINNSNLYIYDESLTLQQEVDVSAMVENRIGIAYQHYIGDGQYYYNDGFRTKERFVLDLKQMTCRADTLSLPNYISRDKIIYDQNHNTYISTEVGILQYHADGTLTTRLEWSEVGIDVNSLDVFNGIWALHENAFVVAQTERNHGRSETTYTMISVSETQVKADKEVIRVNAFLDKIGWLNEAVHAFNMQSDTYRVDLDVNQDMNYDENIQQLLLDPSGTDMLILPNDGYYTAYYDKNAFLDLSALAGHHLLGGIFQSEQQKNGAVYTFPLTFAFTALAAKEGIVAQDALTWDALYDLRDSLGEGAVLMAPTFSGTVDGYRTVNGQKLPLEYEMSALAETMYYSTLADFVHEEEMRASFDSEKFRNAVEFMRWLDSHVDVHAGGTQFNAVACRISTGVFPRRLRDGGVLFAETAINDVTHFTILDMLFGDAEYMLYGYPGTQTDRIVLDSKIENYFPAVLASTDQADGCIAFLEFLLSDDMQLADSSPALPVTVSAMQKMLDENDYQYYSLSMYEEFERGSDQEFSFIDIGTTAEYMDDYGLFYDTESTYVTFSFTEEKKQQIMDFFTRVQVHTAVDRKVSEIVNEELSYWANDARTLEETTKIIDSRVWIYLNE